jgi:hypoxanthine-guanine phosphoribosyltransferase
MISYDDIVARTAQLAKLINEDYKDERPVLICVLKGASPVSVSPFVHASLIFRTFSYKCVSFTHDICVHLGYHLFSSFINSCRLCRT